MRHLVTEAEGNLGVYAKVVRAGAVAVNQSITLA
jgi:MOSC domain-containing protein YiiM